MGWLRRKTRERTAEANRTAKARTSAATGDDAAAAAAVADNMPALPAAWAAVHYRVLQVCRDFTRATGEATLRLSADAGSAHPWVQIRSRGEGRNELNVTAHPRLTPELLEQIGLVHPLAGGPSAPPSRLTCDAKTAAAVSCHLLIAAGVTPERVRGSYGDIPPRLTRRDLPTPVYAPPPPPTPTPAPVRPPRPELRLIRSPYDAELVAAEWMRWFGFPDAKVTPVGADGGIDVASSSAVAQVKLEGKPTGRPVVQALFGVATAAKKRGLFFSHGGYTPEASRWADLAGIALFTFDFQGEPCPHNNLARALMELGAGEPD